MKLHSSDGGIVMSMIKFLGAGALALAAASPAAAQYYGYSQYGYAQPYGYAQSYGYAQPYAYGVNTSLATQQCTAAVQSRLYNRTSLGSILGSLVGIPTASYGRVVSVTRINARSDGMLTVRGLASSGRYAMNGYGPYGVGAYGALGYNYANAADLSFRCLVAPNGSVYNVSINRRY
jgi:hypothetical protein